MGKIHIPVWVMTGERCGSWHLCDLLEQAFSLPSFLELPMAYGIEKSLWLKKLPKSLFKKPFAHLKVIRSHFERSGLSDEDRRTIENSLPGVKYIWLWRNCVYERAASLYCAEQTKIWRYLDKKQSEKHANQMIDIDEDALFKCLLKTKNESKNNWQGYFESDDQSVIKLSYEELVNNTAKSLKSISDWLGVSAKELNPRSIRSTNKLTRDIIEILRRLDG